MTSRSFSQSRSIVLLFLHCTLRPNVLLQSPSLLSIESVNAVIVTISENHVVARRFLRTLLDITGWNFSSCNDDLSCRLVSKIIIEYPLASIPFAVAILEGLRCCYYRGLRCHCFTIALLLLFGVLFGVLFFGI